MCWKITSLTSKRAVISFVDDFQLPMYGDFPYETLVFDMRCLQYYNSQEKIQIRQQIRDIVEANPSVRYVKTLTEEYPITHVNVEDLLELHRNIPNRVLISHHYHHKIARHTTNTWQTVHGNTKSKIWSAIPREAFATVLKQIGR